MGLAADAGGLEGDGAAAAEGIADARDAAEAALAEFADEFGEGAGGGAEVGVDFFPGFRRRAVDVFRAVAEGDLLVVGEAEEDAAFEGGAEVLEDGFEAGFFLLVGFGAPGGGVGFVFGGFARGGEFEDFLGLEALEAAEQAVVIEGEQGEEAGAVGLGIVGGG
jgi:hypothetical protein